MTNYHFDYFKKEEEEKQDMQARNQAHLINVQIRNIIQMIDSDVLEDEETLDKEEELNRYLIQTSVRNVGWQNNLESINTAFVQMEWIFYLLLNKKFTPNSSALENLEQIKEETGRHFIHVSSFYSSQSILTENNADIETQRAMKEILFG